ncbi:MAG: glycosyltransferase [Rhodospirillaceae bacterium]|nr:glycosyltransferase [Rhodospirillales bacterium]
MTGTLLHVFPTFDVGGSQMRMATIANYFGPRWRHVVMAQDGRTACAQRLKIDVTLVTPPSGLLARRRILRDLAPSRLVTYNWGSMDWVMANWPGLIPHLHVEDGFGPDEATGQLKRRVFARMLLLRRSTVLLPSQTLYAIARNVWRLPARCLRYVPNGIDCDRFALGDQGIFPPDPPIIGTVAALRPEKNIARLVDAFARVVAQRPAQLIIVGDGPERPALTNRVRALGLTDLVTFTGAHPNPERLLPSFAVFALSSDTEQMPISLLEAMAAGLPVAATDVGDVRAMLPRANPVTAKSTEALAQALLDLLAEPNHAEAVGRANAVHVRNAYDQATMFSAWAKLLQ